MKDIINYPEKLIDFINGLNIINYYDKVQDRDGIENRFIIKYAFDVGAYIYMDLLILKETKELYLYFLDKRLERSSSSYIFKFFGISENYLNIKRKYQKDVNNLFCVDNLNFQSDCFYKFMDFVVYNKSVFGVKYGLK